MEIKYLLVTTSKKQTIFWLKEGINNIHKEFDINRTQWPILNYIQTNNSIERAKIIEIMEIFDSKENIENTIEKLIWRELIFEKIVLKLTEKGKNLFNNALQRQNEFRQKSMKDITEQEYSQTICTLEKIIGNLIWIKKNKL